MEISLWNWISTVVLSKWLSPFFSWNWESTQNRHWVSTLTNVPLPLPWLIKTSKFLQFSKKYLQFFVFPHKYSGCESSRYGGMHFLNMNLRDREIAQDTDKFEILNIKKVESALHYFFNHVTLKEYLSNSYFLL